MPFTDNRGIRIHFHVEGTGPPIVLQHGLSGRMGGWYENGFIDALKNGYTVIAVDARGHGGSDKPYEPAAYDQRVMASDIVAILDHLEIDKAHYVGYSMGGSIGFALADTAPERLLSVSIGGMHPYPMDRDLMQPMIEALGHGIKTWVASIEKSNPNMPAWRKEQMLDNDAGAILGASIGLRDRVDMSHVLPKMDMPCLVYAGDADSFHVGAKKCVENMPNVRWVSLPDLDHIQTFEQGEVVLPHLNEFLKQAVPII